MQIHKWLKIEFEPLCFFFGLFSIFFKMVIATVEEATKRIVDICVFSPKLEEVLSFLLKEHLSFKESTKKG